MPEIRQNPATKEWVVIATERARRPEEFVEMGETGRKIPVYSKDCPFCPGNEASTPPEIISVVGSDGKWSLRVVPNKFPALIPEGESVRDGDFGFFRSMDGLGQHEVIIETPLHNASFGDISDDKALEIVKAYRTRYLDLSSDKRFKLVTVFRNQGKEAGTSIEHPHSQIVATPVVPLHIRHRLEEATRFFDNHGECVFCRMLEMEKKDGKRIVMDSESFLVIEPFASRMPFETWIIPNEHHASFGEVGDTELSELARVMNRLLEKFNRCLGSLSYNLVVRTVPVGEEGEDYYHWHIQLIPRLTTPAGFELGTGVYINTSLPEAAAKFLRKA